MKMCIFREFELDNTLYILKSMLPSFHERRFVLPEEFSLNLIPSLRYLQRSYFFVFCLALGFAKIYYVYHSAVENSRVLKHLTLRRMIYSATRRIGPLLTR